MVFQWDFIDFFESSLNLLISILLLNPIVRILNLDAVAKDFLLQINLSIHS